MSAVITVTYKSGREVRISCESCEVVKDGRGGISSITIVGGRPRALFFGVRDIESVYEERP